MKVYEAYCDIINSLTEQDKIALSKVYENEINKKISDIQNIPELKDIISGKAEQNFIPLDLQMSILNKDSTMLTKCSQDVALITAVKLQMGLNTMDSLLAYYLIDRLTGNNYSSIVIKGIMDYRKIGICYCNDLQLDKMKLSEGVSPTSQINITLQDNNKELSIRSIINNEPIHGTTSIEDCLLTLLDSLYLCNPDVFIKSITGRFIDGNISVIYSGTRKSNINFYRIEDKNILIADTLHKNNLIELNKAYEKKEINLNKTSELCCTNYSGEIFMKSTDEGLISRDNINMNIRLSELLVFAGWIKNI